jgi:hypothetical protein
LKTTVFIQANRKQLFGAKVAAFSFKARASRPETFDIRIMVAEDTPHIHSKHGQKYLREGRDAIWNTKDLQSFTTLRFLPPQLMGFQGRAIVTDPDVFALGDICELVDWDMQGKAVWARQVPGKNGAPPYFATSVMLLDCAKLKHWQWDQQINDMFAMKRDYRTWMSLEYESRDTVGVLPDYWNHYDTLNQQTKLIHNTGRLTQPWKTGLAIDFSSEKFGAVPPTKKWGIIPINFLRWIKCVAKGEKYYPSGVYLPHPDKRQEQFFFGLVKEGIEMGVLKEEDVRNEIELKNIRNDALELTRKVTRFELRHENH